MPSPLERGEFLEPPDRPHSSAIHVRNVPIRQVGDAPPPSYRSPPFAETSKPTNQPISSAYATTSQVAPLPPTPARDYYRRSSSSSSMSNARLYANISLGLRLFVLLLVVISLILVMTAPGVCFWRTINGQQTSREVCPPSNALFPMNIDRWDSALHFQDRGKRVWGQLAIIIISIIVALPPLILSCVHFSSGRSNIYGQAAALLVGVIAFIIFGSFETWYATGFDWMPAFIRSIGGGVFSGCVGIPACDTGFVVKGWAAAAAFYFFCALFYVIDLFIVYLRKENSSDRVTFRHNSARTAF
ncbi:hypothetical protein M3Y94_00135700 [Aphelenchoides besseyi]|nr:hypothetical protein M3Y94_00135700 [Aphelenchoides besseyi]KAI6237299.1 hypothetical protein M3Y95_00250400 [Aphelenchoides besseyi]